MQRSVPAPSMTPGVTRPPPDDGEPAGKTSAKVPKEKRCPKSGHYDYDTPADLEDAKHMLETATTACIGRWKIVGEPLSKLRVALGSEFGVRSKKLCSVGFPNISLIGQDERMFKIGFCRNRGAKHGFMRVGKEVLLVASPDQLDVWLRDPSILAE